MFHRLLKWCAPVAVGLVVAAAPMTAKAIGYYNVPGTCCQWFGYGCGAGYHAPLVLGPISARGCCAHGVERLPYAPCSTCAGAACGCNYAGDGYEFGEPSRLEPSAEPLPTPTPELAPAPAAYRVPYRY